MKTPLLLLCLLAFCTRLQAQVLVGNPVGLVSNAPDETLNISVFTTSFGQFTEPKEDSLDFDRNGQFDVVFSAFCCNTFDCLGGTNSLSSIHSKLEWVVDSALNLQKLPEGHRVDSAYLWRSAGYTTIVSKISGFGGYMESGNWRPDPTGFAGFRLCNSSDTLYGWVKIQATANNSGSASIKVMEWAIQADPNVAPQIQLSIEPNKAIYCAGDLVQVHANVVGADELAWQLPDGTTLNTPIFQYQIPDSSFSLTFMAINSAGVSMDTLDIQVSPLMLHTEDVHLNCLDPVQPIVAYTNVPATLYWLFQGDTIPFPVFTSTVYQVIAVDLYGCRDEASLEVIVDFDVPVIEVDIQNVPEGILLLAQSGTPGVVFAWQINSAPTLIPGDSLLVNGDGTYTVYGTAPNGCVGSADVIIFVDASTLEAEQIQVFPNPFFENFTVKNDWVSPVFLQLLDANGKTQLPETKVPAQDNYTFNAAQLPSGTYFLTGIQVGGRQLWIKKLVKH